MLHGGRRQPRRPGCGRDHCGGRVRRRCCHRRGSRGRWWGCRRGWLRDHTHRRAGCHGRRGSPRRGWGRSRDHPCLRTRGGPCGWGGRRRGSGWRGAGRRGGGLCGGFDARTGGRCRIPREMRPIPQHLRRCSADPAPTLQNCLSMRRPSRHDARMGAGSVGRSAGSAHLARNKSASRVE